MTNGRQHRLALPAGYKLHWYEIESILGQGGFGITYLARDTNLNQPVAIKEFLPTDLAVRTHDSSVHPISDGHTDTYGWGLNRFLTEAQTLAKFRHPNIVLVHSVFEENNTAYMVMEYVEGRTLEDALKFKNIESEAEFKRIIFAILDGLELIHNEGFIHRDIKPENIYLREDGTPVLLDFGSARQAIGGKTRTLTALVSPGYAPYEQYDSSRRSEGKQGPWTDIYALGATLYRAVTGHGPPDSMQRVSAVVDGKDIYQPAAMVVKGSYSRAFLRAIDWALEFKPENRPQSIGDWRKAMEMESQVSPDADTEIPELSEPPKIEKAKPPTAAKTRPSDSHVIDSKVAAPSPPLELPGRQRREHPVADRPVPQAQAPKPKRPLWMPMAGVVVLAAVAGAVYWGGLVPVEKSDEAPVSEQPQLAAIEEELSPEETARARVEEAKRKAGLLQKQLEVQQKQLAEQQELAQAEAAKLTELEAARERTERIARLLAEAESDLKEGRLIRPAKNSAFYRFNEVLGIDSKNAGAKAGLERIVLGIVQRAGKATEKHAFAEAANHLAEADMVLPGSESVAKARAALAQAERAAEEEQRRIAEAKRLDAEKAARRKAEQAREAKITTLLALAEQDLKTGRLTSPEGNNALVRYRDVLNLDQNNAAAKIGVEAVVTGLVTLESEARSRNDFARAAEYLAQAEAIDPNAKRVIEARTALGNARKTYELERTRLAEQQRKQAEAAAEAKAESGKATEIEGLLAKAENDLKVLRLTSPPGTNALERYQRVLELDPGNAEAESGILKIGEKYLELKDKAIAQQNFDKAKSYLDKAAQVLPGSELLAIARDEYELARTEYEQGKAEQEAAASATRESEQLAKALAELERLKAKQERIEQLAEEKKSQVSTAADPAEDEQPRGRDAESAERITVIPEKIEIKLSWEHSLTLMTGSYSRSIALRDRKFDVSVSKGMSRVLLKGEFAKDGFSMRGTINGGPIMAYDSASRFFKINGRLTDGQFSSNFQTGVGAQRTRGRGEFDVRLILTVVE